jgi:proteic killer suppression protein
VHIGHEVGSVRHEGRRRLIEDDDRRPIRPDPVNPSVAFSTLHSAQDVDGLLEPPRWRIHQLCGNRSGTWSMSVSGNWRTMMEQWTWNQVIHGAKGQGAMGRRLGFRPGHCRSRGVDLLHLLQAKA